MTNRQSETTLAADIYVVETPRGFTESFDRHTIDVLERLGLVRHLRDGHVLEDGNGRGVGPLHRFYGPAALPCDITVDGWCATHSTGSGPVYCGRDRP